ncbi:MAG: exopolyphosphatase [Lachnospiraceae bacterium]|nr:exopolyphosphatase [Lachnospiraceae bacterium]
MKIFAAIDVGSYEIGMKIFELSRKNGVKEIDYIRHRIDLGTDSYNTGKLSYERMDELCSVLKGFKDIMDSYHADSYRAFGTSAIRETDNTKVILDQIKLRTGLTILPLSNSEQRFLDYKSVALKSRDFHNIIDSGTAFIDIGGGSTQVSLFASSKLIATVNLRLGILRLRRSLRDLQPASYNYEDLLSELIDNEIHTLKKMYLKKLDIRNIIVVDDHLPYILHKLSGEGIDRAESGRDQADRSVTAAQFVKFIDRLKQMSGEQVAKEVGIPMESASLLIPSAFIIKHMIKTMGAEKIYVPGVSLSDGIAYDYAEKNKLIRSDHDFGQDIISSVENISARYRGSQNTGNLLSKSALAVFDGMKKYHGLDARGRLLLEIASRLRDVGRFISLVSPGPSAYPIIMGTEIIGLSHLEREMVAVIVSSSYPKDLSYEDVMESGFDEKSYLTVVKLTAILRLSSGMVRNYKRKFNGVKAVVKDKELIITVDTEDDIALEKGLFFEKTGLFEEVFGLKPVLKKKL